MDNPACSTGEADKRGFRTGALPNHALYRQGAISRWDEGLPLGNGTVGCLIYGDGAPLRFCLDRGDLWDLRIPEAATSPDFTYRELVRLVQAGDRAEVVRRFESFYAEVSYPTKLTAGALEYRLDAPASKIESEVTVRDGCARLSLSDAAGKMLSIQCMLHAVDGLGYVRLTGNRSGTAGRWALVSPDYAGTGRRLGQAADDQSGEPLHSLGYPAAAMVEEGNSKGFTQRIEGGKCYSVLWAERKGAAGEEEGVFVVLPAEEERTHQDTVGEYRHRLRSALKRGFAAAYREHAAWWSAYWRDSALSLPDKQAEFQWYWNQYLFASASRKGSPPMPLQGVWTADNGRLPPWKGDYHNDLNVQMSYWHYGKANHLEEGESLLDFLWNLRPAARRFAEKFYEAPGINLPSVMTIDGRPMGGWAMYSYSITNQIWLCQAFDHFWMYTGDEEFLRERAYVYFAETAECIVHWLTPDDGGLLRLPLSSSPEINDNRMDAWMPATSNYDLALLIYLFERLTAMASRLGLEDEARRWNGYRIRFPALAVDEQSALLVAPNTPPAESHRHHSHLMAVYPLKLLRVRGDGSDAERRTIEASIRQMEMHGRGQWVGYSFGWAASMYARLGSGEAALYHLRQFWNCFCSPNGFHLNGDFRGTGSSSFHYRPFTLEGNFAAADALQEMLLQSDNGIIYLFPSIPEDWRSSFMSFENWRTEGGVLVSAWRTEEGVQAVRLLATHGTRCRMANVFGSDDVTLAGPGRACAGVLTGLRADSVIEQDLRAQQSIWLYRGVRPN